MTGDEADSAPWRVDLDALIAEFEGAVRDLHPVDEFPPGAFGWVVLPRGVEPLGLGRPDEPDEAAWGVLAERARRASAARATLLGRATTDDAGRPTVYVLHLEHADPAVEASEYTVPITLGDRPPKPSRFRAASPRSVLLGTPEVEPVPRRVWR